MSEPTIDEILAWFHQVQERVRIAEREPYLHRPAYFDAIRAILEQHRDNQNNPLYQDIALEIIRTFVVRVEQRLSNDVDLETALYGELSTLEQEIPPKT